MFGKIIILSLKKIRRNIFINLILMIQIFLTIITLNITIGKIQYYDYVRKIVERSNIKDAYYFYIGSRFAQGTETTYRLVDEELNKLDGVTDIGRAYNFPVGIPKYNLGLPMIAYNRALLSNIFVPVYKGGWNNHEEKMEGNAIPVVVSSALEKYLKVGQSFEFELLWTKPKDSGPKKLKAKVMGVLNKQGYYYDLNAGGNETLLSDLFGRKTDVIISLLPVEDIYWNIELQENAEKILF